jgi:hypothetical protein
MKSKPAFFVTQIIQNLRGPFFVKNEQRYSRKPWKLNSEYLAIARQRLGKILNKFVIIMLMIISMKNKE